MSKWRKKALEHLPEMRQVVETSKSPSELWIEIERVFFELINSDNHNLSRRILQYADWCTSAEAGDVANATNQAVYCGFLEEIAQHKNNWPLFKEWFTKSQFEKYKGSFKYSLVEKEFNELENIYYGR